MFILIALLLFGIIFYNLCVSLSRLSSIIRYSFDTNSLGHYWSYFFKHCVSFRAVYSGIFMLFAAVLIFFVIAPVILLRRLFFKSRTEREISNGQYFDYSQALIHSDVPLEYFTNSVDYGIEKEGIIINGNIENDIYSVVNATAKRCEEKGIEFRYFVLFENYIIESDTSQVIPLMLYVNDDPFPVYFVYNEFQKEQYNKARNILSGTKFKNCIYFSIVSMESARPEYQLLRK